MKSPDDIREVEFDWLGCDADGHVALFTTAGGGHAPREFLRDTDAHDAAIQAILATPASTTARFAPDLPSGFVNTWRLVAERGLFAFDSDVFGGPYLLVAAPPDPHSSERLTQSRGRSGRPPRVPPHAIHRTSVISANDLQSRGEQT